MTIILENTQCLKCFQTCLKNEICLHYQLKRRKIFHSAGLIKNGSLHQCITNGSMCETDPVSGTLCQGKFKMMESIQNNGHIFCNTPNEKLLDLASYTVDSSTVDQEISCFYRV
jgi:hypothetical protein